MIPKAWSRQKASCRRSNIARMLTARRARPVIVDLRNIYRPEDMAKYGFTYESIGRPHLQADISFELEDRGTPVGSRSAHRPAYVSADMTARLEIAKARWD